LFAVEASFGQPAREAILLRGRQRGSRRQTRRVDAHRGQGDRTVVRGVVAERGIELDADDTIIVVVDELEEGLRERLFRGPLFDVAAGLIPADIERVVLSPTTAQGRLSHSV